MLICLVLLTSIDASSQVRLPRLISDGMVLQRDDSVKIWGWAAPGEEVRVDFVGNNYRTRADASGEWLIMLSPTAGRRSSQHEDRSKKFNHLE